MPHRRTIPAEGYGLGYCDGLQEGLNRSQEQAFKAGVEVGFQQGFEECKRRMLDSGYSDVRSRADRPLFLCGVVMLASAALLFALAIWHG